ncbi:hypothetical protein CCACVL1_02116, partial [Corchorus capsularis]
FQEEMSIERATTPPHASSL